MTTCCRVSTQFYLGTSPYPCNLFFVHFRRHNTQKVQLLCTVLLSVSGCRIYLILTPSLPSPSSKFPGFHFPNQTFLVKSRQDTFERPKERKTASQPAKQTDGRIPSDTLDLQSPTHAKTHHTISITYSLTTKCKQLSPVVIHIKTAEADLFPLNRNQKPSTHRRHHLSQTPFRRNQLHN